MVLNSKGYVYTLLIATLSLITLSLLLFQSQVNSPSFQGSTNKMQVDEMSFFIESLKDDASRAIAISGQRSAAYAIDHVINTNESFRYYTMNNCTSFNYTGDGIQAVLTELIICGNLTNTQYPAEDIDSFMANNTIISWQSKINGQTTSFNSYNVTISLRNMDMALIDSWHFLILSEFDIDVCDRDCTNRYVGQRIPITSVVDITTLEDPLYHTKSEGKLVSTLRTFTPCEKKQFLNGSIFDDRIEDGCYISSDDENYNGPSFFDRLENSIVFDRQRFYFDKYGLYQKLGYYPANISLESLINLALLDEYGVESNPNASQVDSYYWHGRLETIGQNCYVDGMEQHPDFRIDMYHAIKYKVQGLNCHVVFTNTSANPNDFRFDPDNLRVPPNTTITFIDQTGSSRVLYESEYFTTGQVLPANGRITQTYDLTSPTGQNYFVYDNVTSEEINILVEHI
ncbi:MAG: hypothetical protein KKD39_01870 [Candidatus Altiarchaeota archaeon]|nr:hypothetical protein [Candidatus Altiarchaeota archaeon]